MSNTTDNEMIDLLFGEETSDDTAAPLDETAIDDEDESQSVEMDEESDEEMSDEGADEDEEAEDEDTSDEDTETLYTVKVDGEDVQVSLEDLTKSYSGQKYIQAKMRETADQRKRAIAAADMLDRYVKGLANGGMMKEPVEPELKDFDKDPIRFRNAMARYKSDMQAYQRQQAEIQQVRQFRQQHEAETMRAALQEQMDYIKASIPEMADKATARAHVEKLASVAREYGFSDDEIQSAQDGRYYVLLNDAMRWRELQNGKKDALKRVHKSTPSGKGSRSTRRSSLDQMKSNPTGAANADAFMRFLDVT